MEFKGNSLIVVCSKDLGEKRRSSERRGQISISKNSLVFLYHKGRFHEALCSQKLQPTDIFKNSTFVIICYLSASILLRGLTLVKPKDTMTC